MVMVHPGHCAVVVVVVEGAAPAIFALAAGNVLGAGFAGALVAVGPAVPA